MKMKINSSMLAEAGITGGLAVVLIMLVIAFLLALNLGIFALIGVVFAYLWNTFVVPNVDAGLPTLVWWQAGLCLMALRVLMGIIMPSRS